MNLKPGTDCIRAPYIARSLRDMWDAMHSPPLSSDFAFDFRPTRHNPGAAALRERRRTLTAWTDETMKSQTRAGRGFIASHICPQRTRAYMGHGCFFFARRVSSRPICGPPAHRTPRVGLPARRGLKQATVSTVASRRRFTLLSRGDGLQAARERAVS